MTKRASSQPGSSRNSWLSFQPVASDEGELTALYPYRQLREIQEPVHARLAVIDETRALEREFGVAVISPLYGMLWSLNGVSGMATSHCLVAPSEQRPIFPWASSMIACQILMLSRCVNENLSLRPNQEAAKELYGLLQASEKCPRDPTGWLIEVGLVNFRFLMVPQHVVYTSEADLVEHPGYGVSIRICGCASSRSKAAERWSRAALFIADSIDSNLAKAGMVRADPHRHMAGSEELVIGRDLEE